jgi:hypothetical protein
MNFLSGLDWSQPVEVDEEPQRVRGTLFTLGQVRDSLRKDGLEAADWLYTLEGTYFPEYDMPAYRQDVIDIYGRLNMRMQWENGCWQITFLDEDRLVTVSTRWTGNNPHFSLNSAFGVLDGGKLAVPIGDYLTGVSLNPSMRPPRTIVRGVEYDDPTRFSVVYYEEETEKLEYHLSNLEDMDRRLSGGTKSMFCPCPDERNFLLRYFDGVNLYYRKDENACAVMCDIIEVNGYPVCIASFIGEKMNVPKARNVVKHFGASPALLHHMVKSNPDGLTHGWEETLNNRRDLFETLKMSPYPTFLLDTEDTQSRIDDTDDWTACTYPLRKGASVYHGKDLRSLSHFIRENIHSVFLVKGVSKERAVLEGLGLPAMLRWEGDHYAGLIDIHYFLKDCWVDEPLPHLSLNGVLRSYAALETWRSKRTLHVTPSYAQNVSDHYLFSQFIPTSDRDLADRMLVIGPTPALSSQVVMPCKLESCAPSVFAISYAKVSRRDWNRTAFLLWSQKSRERVLMTSVAPRPAFVAVSTDYGESYRSVDMMTGLVTWKFATTEDSLMDSPYCRAEPSALCLKRLVRAPHAPSLIEVSEVALSRIPSLVRNLISPVRQFLYEKCGVLVHGVKGGLVMRPTSPEFVPHFLQHEQSKNPEFIVRKPPKLARARHHPRMFQLLVDELHENQKVEQGIVAPPILDLSDPECVERIAARERVRDRIAIALRRIDAWQGVPCPPLPVFPEWADDIQKKLEYLEVVGAYDPDTLRRWIYEVRGW